MKHTGSITVKDYVKRKALGINGLIMPEINPQSTQDRLTFVNDLDSIIEGQIKEYNIWYSGDSDELLNFYTRSNSIDFNYNPVFNRNKKSYFWAVSSTEGDIKRTHSGQPRNVVDTICNIVGVPKIGVGGNGTLKPVSERLDKILKDNNFTKLFIQKQLPYTLVEGWGAYKINWDKSLRDTPILLYYRADNVDFVYRSGQVVAIIYRDYYVDEKGNRYVLFETRKQERRKCTIKENDNYGKLVPCLIIEKDLFKQINANYMIPCKLTELPQLKDVKERLILEDYKGFLGCPCIIYEDNTGDCYGRSIFKGKIDIMDDLDQDLSLNAITCRRSAPHEYFNSMFLEKDARTGMPIMPHDFDRKYVMYKGPMLGDGQSGNASPVLVTQPSINFQQYTENAIQLLLQFISGIMSPATLGIDIAKKDNAEAQREKEKVTIFTRNTIIAELVNIYKQVGNELLCAQEFMDKEYITCQDYSVYVKFDEFADSSWESKLESIAYALENHLVTPKLAVDMLYKDTISAETKNEIIDNLKMLQDQAQQGAMGIGEQEMSPEELGMFGELGAENEHNDRADKSGAEGLKQDTVGEVPDINEQK